MKPSTFDLLAGSALMRGASAAALSALTRARLQTRQLQAGTLLFQAGDRVDAIYLLLSAKLGQVQIDVDPLVRVELSLPGADRPLRFERIVHGEIFGELEFFEHGMLSKEMRRSTSALAITPSTVVALPLVSLSEILECDAAVRARFVRTASQRLLSALKQRHERLHAHPDLLLADWLVELSADIGIAEGNRVRFPRKIAQADIAADLGVSRETISRRLNEWERSGLLRTGARSQQIEILDYQRISRLASLRSSRSREALERSVDDIDAAVACGDLVRARNIGLDILRHYPSSPDLHHRVALAAARSGDHRGGLEHLTRCGLPLGGELGALEKAVEKARQNPFLPMDRILAEPWVESSFGDPEGDQADTSRLGEAQLVEDLAALHARLLKEQAFAPEVSEEERHKHAAASQAAYHALFQQRRGYYPGINAATMALIAGEADNARQIAGDVAGTLASAGEAYWPLVTHAEALLISGDRDGAAKMLRRTRTAPGADNGAKASTILQFRRLGAVLRMDVEALVKELGPSNVAAFSGHMFRGAEMDEKDQADAETAIRASADAILGEHNVRFLYGALACGSDIIIAEAAMARGAELNVVLPFSTGRFIETSVRLGDPPQHADKWEARFRTLLDNAASLTVMDASEPAERDLNGLFYHAFRYAAGLALQRAAMLQTSCRLIIVSDEAEADSIAGTNRAFSDWSKSGRPYDLIVYPHRRRGRPSHAPAPLAFRPVVFLWPPSRDDAGRALEAVAHAAAPGREPIERIHRDGRRGLCLLAETTGDAFDTASRSIAASLEAGAQLRVVCDFGLALGPDLAPDRKLIARLQAADDFPGLPTDTVLATEAFATQAKVDWGDRVRLTPVGRAEPSGSGEDGSLMRSRPSLPIFSFSVAADGLTA